MDLHAEVVAPCRPDQLWTWVDDLARYPSWLEIVTRAEAIEGPDPAWSVDLRGRLGPLARSKRLRMVRTVHEPGSHARFERAELDGRQHSPWVLDAEVMPHDDGARLAMGLHYGGSLFGPVLERVLREEIDRSRVRLLDLVAVDAAEGAP